MKTNASPSGRQAATRRFIGPVAQPLNRAAALSVTAGLVWPVQAACLAWAIAGWAKGAPVGASVAAALFFMLAAAFRAALDHRAGRILFAAADQVIAAERARLIAREPAAAGGDGSAVLAALLTQKLPLVQPWITRYHVAMARVAVLPPVFMLLVFVQSWTAGLVLLVAGPLIPVFMALVGMAAEQASRRQLAEIGTMNGMLMERLAAMLDIRLLGAADRATSDFAERAESLRARTMAVLRVAFLSSTVLELFSALGVALVAVFVGLNLLGLVTFGSWGGPIGLGPALFVLLIAPEFFQPMRDLAAAWHDRAAGFAVAAELQELEEASRMPILGDGGGAPPLTGPFGVRMSGAVAALSGGTLVLPDLGIAAGEAVALVGPSGSGKSTTLAAIAGLLPLASGRIEVCGVDLTPDTADAWRARLAWVAQRPHFPDAALRDWLDPRETKMDPWTALELADARRIVERLPEGLGTRLGETGGGVSGGEARRLMIARAVMQGGDFLLADEPTADLDADTADRVIAALLRLRDAGRTLLVATHDPRLAAAMDRVVEIRE